MRRFLQPRTVLVSGLALQAALVGVLLVAYEADLYLFVLAVLVQFGFAVTALVWSLVSAWVGRLRGAALLLALALPATASSVAAIALVVAGSLHWGC